MAQILLVLAIPAGAQNLPYSIKEGKMSATAVQQNFEFLYNQVHQQKVLTNGIATGGTVTTNVTATSPICSSGGSSPNITFCAAIPESSVTNLISDLSTINSTLSSHSSSISTLNTSTIALAAQDVLIAAATTTIAASIVYQVRIVDDFSRFVDGSSNTFRLSQVPTSTATIEVNVDGLIQFSTKDYQYIAPYVILTTAPAANSDGFKVTYDIYTSSAPALPRLAATNSWSGNNTWSGPSTFTGGIYGTIFGSTATSWSATDTITNTAWATNADVSTLTLVMNGGRASINYSCSMSKGNTVSFWHGVLVDGAYVDGETSARGFMFTSTTDGTVNNWPISFNHVTSTLSAGSHSFVMIFKTDSSSPTIGSATNQRCQFSVTESF